AIGPRRRSHKYAKVPTTENTAVCTAIQKIIDVIVFIIVTPYSHQKRRRPQIATTHHSPLIAHHSSFIAHCSPAHSPFHIPHSPFRIIHPPSLPPPLPPQHLLQHRPFLSGQFFLLE